MLDSLIDRLDPLFYVIGEADRRIERHPEATALLGWLALSVAWGTNEPIGLAQPLAMYLFVVLALAGAAFLVPMAMYWSRFDAAEYVAGFMTIGVAVMLLLILAYGYHGEIGRWAEWGMMLVVGAWSAGAAALFDYGLDLLLGRVVPGPEVEP